MKMDKELARDIIDRYQKGEATEAETQMVDKWLYEGMELKDPSPEELFSDLTQIRSRLHLSETKTRKIKLWPRIAAAVAILLITGASLFYYTSYYAPRHPEGSAATRDLLANNIKPGTNKAILTLANGQQITLNDAANGTIANQSGIKITKTADGQVIYNSSLPSGISPQRGERGVELNTIQTPRGGQYQVHLPDGTQVWLNAASTLKYPITFTGSKDRKVSLSGEAYFEVAKDKTHPFKVTSPTQEVTVLGTHFNINTYPDEPTTKTTLLEGSVQVSTLHPSPLRGEVAKPVRGEQLTLKPNQQSTLKSGAFQIKTIDPELAIAWKNGYFTFNREPLDELMRKVERWYNVQITYEPGLAQLQFSGSISRYDNVSKLLDILQTTGSVHFKIQGNTIQVTR